MTTGLILAGGRATRLGPLAAQLNKSLVSIGNKPMLIRQVQQLQRLSCDRTVVVVSPGACDQVQGVVNRAGLRHVSLRVQQEALGPANAVEVGTAGLTDGVILLLADTLLDDADIPACDGGSVVATSLTTDQRAWCWRSGSAWQDDVADVPVAQVAVGAYSFRSAKALHDAACLLTPDAGMASLLNEYAAATRGPHQLAPVTTWQDVGDVPSVARALRKHFIKRGFHELDLDERGVLTKTGTDAEAEGHALEELGRVAPHLFPRVHDHIVNGYEMEFIDLPTLAELWLYWPGNGVMWTHVIGELYDRLERDLWPRIDAPHTRATTFGRACEEMYRTKLIERWGRRPLEVASATEIEVNGRVIPSGWPQLVRLCEAVLAEVPHSLARIHGDPNFTNVLWSLRTGTFKLLDPRPTWGGLVDGDRSYDLGKIAYSCDFSAVTHGLYDLRRADANEWSWTYEALPTGPRDEILTALVDRSGLTHRQLQLLGCHMALSSAPLHPADEATALYLTAMMTLEKVL